MISEKLIQIAENEPRVYEAGKAKGYNLGLIAGSQGEGEKHIVSGKAVSIYDISDIPHKVKITLKSDLPGDTPVKIKYWPNNLFKPTEPSLSQPAYIDAEFLTNNHLKFTLKKDIGTNNFLRFNYPITDFPKLPGGYLRFCTKVKFGDDGLWGRLHFELKQTNYVTPWYDHPKTEEFQTIEVLSIEDDLNLVNASFFISGQASTKGMSVEFQDIMMTINQPFGEFEPYHDPIIYETTIQEGLELDSRSTGMLLEVIESDDITMNIEYSRDANKTAKLAYDNTWDPALLPKYIFNMTYRFAGRSWTDQSFNPNHDITIGKGGNNANNIFHGSYITDFNGILERNNVWLDGRLYEGSNGFNWFYNCERLSHVGRIKYPEYINSIGNAFAYDKSLHTIEELHFAPDGSTRINSNSFYQCSALENVNSVTGVIGKPNLDLKYSKKLSKQSIINFINAFSTTTSGLTATFSQTAVNNAFETSLGAADGSTSAEWLALIATRSNWTIALADV